ncbi:chemotaxis protein CheW [Pseudoduganella sp. RAF53_2]|uniref:chemotaxis protein CheW n=1 Tax=unclassified Pseudoduganella TaxID=2637179 RepID=UPI003F974F8F
MEKIISENSGPRESLVFKLGNEEYGIDLHKVQEIRSYPAVTRIANAPDFIKGLINLRGTIVPVADMRIKFRLGSADVGPFTAVIILSVRQRLIGLVVDSVSDVMTLLADQVKPAPSMSSMMSVDFITGIGTIDDRMLILLDIDALISSAEMQLMDTASA